MYNKHGRIGKWHLAALLSILLLVSSCIGLPLSSRVNYGNDLCQLFLDKPRWYRAAKKSTERWGGSIHLPMAIMFQESSFKRNAKPPMQYFLGFIPTGRASDAYGYAQALKSTWREYQIQVGSSFRDRDDFADAYDFTQWYIDRTYQRNQISKWDYENQYLNYHEGQGGFSRGTHRNKKWLLNTAKRVDARAKKYSAQLMACRAELDKKADRLWF